MSERRKFDKAYKEQVVIHIILKETIIGKIIE